MTDTSVLANAASPGAPFGVLLLCILAEVAVVMLLMTPRGFNGILVGGAWLVITTATWLVFILGVSVAIAILVPALAEESLWFLVPCEIAGIVIEGYALRSLSTRRFCDRDSAAKLGVPRAMVYSVLINLMSIAVGAVFLAAL